MKTSELYPKYSDSGKKKYLLLNLVVCANHIFLKQKFSSEEQ